MIRSAAGRRSRAFTLIEVLVSSTLVVVLSLLLFGVLQQLSQSFLQVQAQIEPRRNARAVLDLMSRELRAALLPMDRTDQTSLQLLVNPPTTGATAQISTAYLNPHAIFWQAPVATGPIASGSNSSQLMYGDVAEVGYFVRWDLSNPRNPRARLCRYFVNPEDPANLVNYLIYPPASSSTWTANSWLSSSLLESVAPGVANTTTPSLTYKGWIADDVIALWVRCLDANGQLITLNANNQVFSSTVAYTFDSRQGYQCTYGTGGATINSGYTTPSNTVLNRCALPAAIELALVVLDSRSAGLLTSKVTATVTNPPVSTNATMFTPSTSKSFWNDILAFKAGLPRTVQSHAQIYSTKVVLQNAN